MAQLIIDDIKYFLLYLGKRAIYLKQSMNGRQKFWGFLYTYIFINIK